MLRAIALSWSPRLISPAVVPPPPLSEAAEPVGWPKSSLSWRANSPTIPIVSVSSNSPRTACVLSTSLTSPRASGVEGDTLPSISTPDCCSCNVLARQPRTPRGVAGDAGSSPSRWLPLPEEEPTRSLTTSLLASALSIAGPGSDCSLSMRYSRALAACSVRPASPPRQFRCRPSSK